MGGTDGAKNTPAQLLLSRSTEASGVPLLVDDRAALRRLSALLRTGRA
jgi:hypothetical protein